MEEASNGFGKYALKFLVRKLSDDPDLTVIGKENKQTNKITSFCLKKDYAVESLFKIVES